MRISFLLVFVFLFGSCTSQKSLDSFGGNKRIPFEKGPFFRLHSSGNKHFLISPEGHAYVALGINHFHMVKTQNFDEMISQIKAMGFNAGCYQGPEWMWNRIPYTSGVNLLPIRSYDKEGKFAFKDVFDPEYLEELEKSIRDKVKPQASNTLLIAYFLTDMPVWLDKKDGKGWLDFYKNLPNNAPGKKIWEEWKSTNPTKNEADFIPLIAKQIYKEGTELIRKYDSNHLIFSDRYNEKTFPLSVAKEALAFVDGIATQAAPTYNPDYFEILYKELKKPIYIADHVSSFYTDKYPVTMEQIANTEKENLEFYSDYVNRVLKLPYVVGFNKCQYMHEDRISLLKQGLVNQAGKPYSYTTKLHKVHKRALEGAYKRERLSN